MEVYYPFVYRWEAKEEEGSAEELALAALRNLERVKENAGDKRRHDVVVK